VAQAMKKYGVNVDWQQCLSKWKLLNLKFQKIHDSKNHTGDGATTWALYPLMYDILKDRPTTKPSLVLSSLKSAESQPDCSEQQDTLSMDDEEADEGSSDEVVELEEGEEVGDEDDASKLQKLKDDEESILRSLIPQMPAKITAPPKKRKASSSAVVHDLVEFVKASREEDAKLAVKMEADLAKQQALEEERYQQEKMERKQFNTMLLTNFEAQTRMFNSMATLFADMRDSTKKGADK
jgi:hypothetical protein